MSNHAPTMKWHPETGESKIFNHPSEAPADWLDTHPDNVTKAVAFKDAPMSKDEIVAALSAGGVQFDTTAKAKVLQPVLREAVLKALADYEYDPNLTTKELLALLPDPE